MIALFWLAVCGLFGYFIYFLVTEGTDPTYQRLYTRSVTNTAKPINSPDDTNFLLPKDRTQTIGNLKITYRGTRDQMIILDFVLLDLDPQYAYRRRIPQDEARRGFYLSAHHFVVDSVNQHSLRLIRAIE
jgi:hypothetical protein